MLRLGWGFDNMLFRRAICCSGTLYGCSGGLYVEENNDVVATNVVASPMPERQPTGMLTARANL